jgi:NAD(P)H-dependent FMN reductase
MKVLALSGSLPAASINSMLLRAMARVAIPSTPCEKAWVKYEPQSGHSSFEFR